MKKVRVLSWCIYDFASTIFMMNVVSLCFVQWLDQKFGNGDDRYSVISAIVYALCLLMYPVIGEICDRGWRLIPLGILTLLSVLATSIIGYCDNLWAAALLFIVAYLTYQLALTYYNALLDDIAHPSHFGIVSGLGVAARYIGTIVGLLVIDFFISGKQALLPAFLHPLLLYQIPAGSSVKIYANGFLPTGILYLLFALPLFIFVRAKKRNIVPKKTGIIATLIENFRLVLRSKNTVMMLITMLLGGAPVYAAIHFMSVIIKKIGGVSDNLVIPVLIASTFFSVLGGLGLGLLLRPLGNKPIFSTVLLLWAGIFFMGSFLGGTTMIWVLGAVAGLGMGGFWATARILVLDLAPKGREGEYMSLFGMVIVLCGILGSLLWKLGLVIANVMSASFAPQRISLFLLAMVGFIALWTFRYVTFPKIAKK